MFCLTKLGWIPYTQLDDFVPFPYRGTRHPDCPPEGCYYTLCQNYNRKSYSACKACSELLGEKNPQRIDTNVTITENAIPEGEPMGPPPPRKKFCTDESRKQHQNLQHQNLQHGSKQEVDLPKAPKTASC